jgi:tRNA pseudouridine55 synthase
MENDETQIDFFGGQVLLIDKPIGWTSFDVVNKIRQIIRKNYNSGKIKVGHAGTLDPLASGLMVICTGKATKTIEELQLLEKEYIATIEFGKSTPSYDLETEFDHDYPVDHITEDIVLEVLASFQGEIDQVPPLYSAKHHNGQRAYELARKGDDTKLKAHKVIIHELRLLSINLPEIKVLIKCGKGTYIRSLANDIGISCKSGAYLKSLQRTGIPPYSLEGAMNLRQFEDRILNSVSK